MRFSQLLFFLGSSAGLLSSTVSGAALNPDATKSLSARDAFTSQQAGTVSGAGIKAIEMPFSAQASSIPVGDSGAKIFGYWGKRPLPSEIPLSKRAYVIIHGRDRNAEDYYSTINQAFNAAVRANITTNDTFPIRYAPDFFSAALDKAVLNKTTLAWGDPNAWSGGDASVAPAGANVSPFEVLDDILRHFTSKSKFPSMEKVVFIGHGAGAQLLQRYAVVGINSPTSRVSVRYVIGEPSSMLYFSVDRPEAVRASCTWYDDFRYGLSNYSLKNYHQSYDLKGRSKTSFFTRYLKRDVRYLVGMADNNVDSGDQTCPAVTQGGAVRRDRSLNYWAYLHLLAGIKPTPEYPGYFPGLDPNSGKTETIIDKRYTYRKSSKSTIAKFAQTVIAHTFAKIMDGNHTGTAAFISDEGLNAIFGR